LKKKTQQHQHPKIPATAAWASKNSSKDNAIKKNTSKLATY
jgi:hypothetical protein